MTTTFIGLSALPLLVPLGVRGLRDPLRILLPLYALLIPFGSGITVPVGIPSPFNTLTTLVGLAVVAGLSVHILIYRTAAPWRPEVIAWTLFAAVNGLTYLWTVDRSETAGRFVIFGEPGGAVRAREPHALHRHRCRLPA
jgi:hypothetical protein